MPGLQTPYATTYVSSIFAFAWGTIFSLYTPSSSRYRGVLGVHRSANELVARPVHLAADYQVPMRKVATNTQTAIWIDASQRFIATGRNTNGERGIGSVADTTTLAPFAGGPGTTTDVSIGGDGIPPADGGTGGTTFIVGNATVSNSTDVFAAGANASGQMGMGDHTQRTSFTNVWSASVHGATRAVRVQAGLGHTLILDNLGRVWSAGQNNVGQLAQGTSGADVTTWAQVDPPSGGRWYTDIAATSFTSLFLVNDGTVMGAGDGSSGQLGPPSTFPLSPRAVSGLSGIVEMASYGQLSWFRTTDGKLLVYGTCGLFGGMAGTTGSDLFTTALATPREVNINWANTTYPFTPSTAGVTVAKLGYTSGDVGAPSRPVFAVIGSDGRLYTWGSNDRGQRGDGTTSTGDDQERIFYSANGLTGVTGVTTGFAQTFAWGANGTLTLMHFVPTPLHDAKILRQLSTDPADPTNWFTVGFDDSAWPTPVEVTPDPAYPLIEPTEYPRMAIWERNPENGANLNVLIRHRIFVPADTDSLTLPGIRLRTGPYAGASIALGPTGATIGPGSVGGIASGRGLNTATLFLNGNNSDESLWSGESVAGIISPGVVNTFAWRVPNTRILHASTSIPPDPTVWIAMDRVIAYITALFTPPPTGTGASRGRSYAMIIG